MPPTCDELTFRIYVPNTFQRNQVFGPQAGARLLKRVVFGTDDAIVRNDEVVGSIPTSSSISQRLTGSEFTIMFHNVATMRSSVPSGVTPPFVHNLQTGILQLCSRTFQFSPFDKEQLEIS